MIRFFVAGTPAPGGSKRAIVVGGKARVIDDAKGNRDWKSSVAQVAADAYRGPLLEGPLAVSFRFVFPRPSGHFGKRGLRRSARPYPTVKPDALKLARSTEDALSGVLWRDDVQTVHLAVAKEYGEKAGCWVEVRPVEAEP
jgi:Holliday junction resolvase RusA-like endonuclease